MSLPFNPHAAAFLEQNDPASFAKFMEILQLEKLDAERELYENSLLAFFERAWREIDSSELNVNWHHERICDALERITFGENRDLIINIPPRHGKSLLVSVIWPSWVWCRSEKLPLSGPHVKFLCVSYAAHLSERFGLRMLHLVMGPWYQSLWKDRVQILPDQMSRADFGNRAGGERISTSIESGLIGRGGDIQICDDPHSLQSAESDLELASTIMALKEGLPTRVTDPRIAARVMIMQRLRQGDATDYAIENWRSDREHLMYPARFDSTRACPSDPRTEDGELLWPSFWTEEAIKQATKELDEYAVAGQFQQMPVPRGGGIIKREWWQPWPPIEANGTFADGAVVNGRIQPPAFEYIVAWVDTAFTEKNVNDPSAMTVWGVFRAEGRGRIDMRPDGTYVRVADDWGYPKVMLIFGWAKRLPLHGPAEEIPPGISPREWNGPLYREQRQKSWGLVEWVVDTCKRYKVDHLGIETQGGGLMLESELRRLHSDGDWGIETVPARKGKFERLQAVSHLWSAGQIYAPTYEDGTHPTWCEPIIDEITLFPRGKRDDLTDTASGALAHLRSVGIFERREEFAEEELGLQEYSRNRQVPLPYGLG